MPPWTDPQLDACSPWTELRLYVAAAIVTLVVALGLTGVLLVGDRMRWLGHGLAGIGLVSLLALNIIAPAALGDDAIPVLVAALPRLDPPIRSEVLEQLRLRRAELASDPAWTAPAAWNLSRERARAALATLP